MKDKIKRWVWKDEVVKDINVYVAINRAIDLTYEKTLKELFKKLTFSNIACSEGCVANQNVEEIFNKLIEEEK